jgi:lipoate-protein ligase A
MSCRLLIEREPQTGVWNMAFDEALLEAASRRGESILRLYRWSEPTLSLGYFQKSLPADLPEKLQALPRVRRLSGGGAILHHFEWTYSCAIPRTHRLAQKAEQLYEVAHGALIRSLGNLGVQAQLRGEAAGDEAFLCFLRGDPRDVVVSRQKVAGSAQRRRRGAVLQHGSVLLRRSPLAPAVAGISDLAPQLSYHPWLAASDFIGALSPSLFSENPSEEMHPEDQAFATKSIGEEIAGSGRQRLGIDINRR